MSSSEESIRRGEGHERKERPKKRPRACDLCRRKKVRCNGPENSGRECTNCVNVKAPCTYVEESKRRVPSKKYIASLEDRITDLHEAIRQLCPDDKIYDELIRSIAGGNASPERNLISPSHLVQDSPAPSEPGLEAFESWALAIRFANEDIPPPQLDDENDHPLVISSSLDTNHFFGKSSGEMLIRDAISLKKKLVGEEKDPQRVLYHRREEFWVLRPWEAKFETVAPRRYTFPELDLAKDLLDLFFERLNLHLPLLHRPSFERSVRDGLHYDNDGFAAVYLLVCAVGSRFSNDPRVRIDGVDTFHSAGWKWFNQVDIGKTSLLSLPSLYDLQLYCLTVLFLQCSSAPQSVWTMVGIAIRLAQDIGVHRRRSSSPTLEDELWKRAFWILVCMDRVVSVSVGRPCAIQEEDFDLEMPIDCDDEYWEHPDHDQRFKQPPNKPSTITGFILQLRLMHILNSCMRGVYSLSKMNECFGLVGQQWKARIVMELDSSLNKWLDSVPDHLVWDPNRENIQHFSISSLLHCSYHHIRILIHRPFISSPSKPSPFPFPSLSICTNSARACIRIADVYRRRDKVGPPPPVQIAVFTSAIVLLLNGWVGKTSGENADDGIYLLTALESLKASEERWRQAGRIWDVLSELSAMGECPLPRQEGQLNSGVTATTTPSRSLRQPEGQGLLRSPSQLYYMAPDNDGFGTSPTSDEALMSEPFGAQVCQGDFDKPPLDRPSIPSFSRCSLEISQQRHVEQPYPTQGERTVSVSRQPPQTHIMVQEPIQYGFTVHPNFLPFDVSLRTMGSSGAYDSNSALDFMVDENQLYVESLEQPKLTSAYSYGDPIAMWSNAPTGFGLDAWDMYLTSIMSESSREQNSNGHLSGT